MAEHPVDLSRWPRADQFRLFRRYERPHYATTARLDVTRLIAERKPAGVSSYRAMLYAIGRGIHAVPELTMRFRGEAVVRHDLITLSMTVPTQAGSFAYAYVPHAEPFEAFDGEAARLIEAAGTGTLNANTGERDDLAYLSCLPWIDFTSINNALPGPEDCIPRISWGKFVSDARGAWSVAMALEVHHALVDGAQVGAYFAAVQETLDEI